MVPIVSVPAVIADRSAATTEKVPPAPATEIDLLPFGKRVTVPTPALTVPEKVTSLAVMLIDAFVEEMDLVAALVTLPVPSVVMVTPVVPVAFWLSVTEPLEPVEVLKVKALPEMTLDVVMLPLAVRVKVPFVEVTFPLVPILAEPPVVTTEKSPPTEDAAIVRAPALVK